MNVFAISSPSIRLNKLKKAIVGYWNLNPYQKTAIPKKANPTKNGMTFTRFLKMSGAALATVLEKNEY